MSVGLTRVHKHTQTFTHTHIQYVCCGTRAKLTVFQWNDLACFADLTSPPLHPLLSVLILPQGDKEQLVSGAVTSFNPENTEPDRTDYGKGKKVI